MKDHEANCFEGEYHLRDIPRLQKGFRLSIAGAGLEALTHFLSGGSVSILALLFHAFADGGGYKLNIHAAHRSVANPNSARFWDRLIVRVNAMAMFFFAYRVGVEAIARLGEDSDVLSGGWIIFGGLVIAALNVWQYFVVGKGESHVRNTTLNIHNLGDIAEGIVVAATGTVVMMTGDPIFDLWSSGALVVWFLFLGAQILLRLHGHD